MHDRLTNKRRIYLSPPHMGGKELQLVREAFVTNWISPLGPQVDSFEREFCQVVGSQYALAVSSGTAALHLALRLVGVTQGDEVICSTLTFIASATPIVFLGAKPVYIDSDYKTWNMDLDLLAETLKRRHKQGKLPKALVLVHIYGQSADIDPILKVCNRYQIQLIEDAAEALGATYRNKSPGTFSRLGVFSFNGNKIITTGGGGMLVSDESDLIIKARFWATQARDAAPHYEHSEIGYNYRMSNVLAAIGRGQLLVLDERVKARRRNFSYYQESLGDLPGIELMPEAPYGRSTRWLTCITIDPGKFGANREGVRMALEEENIEARPVWKPMHLQPVFAGCECIGGEVAEDLFRRGLCLPSGSSMTEEDLERVVSVIKRMYRV